MTNQGLEVLTRHSSSSRLRILRLSPNPATTPQEASETLIRILRVHLELHNVTPIVAFSSQDTSEDVKHLLNINRAGRVLLISLSVWPG
jgi:DNA uptake protein ComE-like DNA-binding protein